MAISTLRFPTLDKKKKTPYNNTQERIKRGTTGAKTNTRATPNSRTTKKLSYSEWKIKNPKGTKKQYLNYHKTTSVKGEKVSAKTGKVITPINKVEIGMGGAYTIDFTGYESSAGIGREAYGQIYKNGATFGTLRTLSSGTTTYSENLSFTKGDLIQIYAWTNGLGSVANITNFEVKGSAVPKIGVVTVD